MLSDVEIERYARQIVLPEVGGRGQERLRASSVGLYVASSNDVVVGTGVLAGLHLALAGVGRIVVEASSANGVQCEKTLSRLARERDPSATITIGDESASALACVGALPAPIPEVPVACVALRSEDLTLLAGATERLCETCWSNGIGQRLPTFEWPPAAPPLAAALLATMSLRSLLGFASRDRLETVAIGLGQSIPRAISSSRSCAACVSA